MIEVKDNVKNMDYYILCQRVGVTPLGYTDLSKMECRVDGTTVFTGNDLNIKEYFNFPPFSYDKQIKISQLITKNGGQCVILQKTNNYYIECEINNKIFTCEVMQRDYVNAFANVLTQLIDSNEISKEAIRKVLES